MHSVIVLTSILGTLICGLSANARVLHVPNDYGTLGSAMSSLFDGDTILASPGVYTESLTAPALDFTLMSTMRIDSFATELVIIDPTELPGSDSLRLLTLTGGRVYFEDIVFRNRSSMTEGRLASRPAGIVGDTSVHLVEFKRCLFDSVHVGVTGMPIIVIDSCRFIGSRGLAVSTSRYGKVHAEFTWFDGATVSLVNTRRGCSIKNCLFTHKGLSYMLLALGDSVIIDDCRFVGLDTLNQRAVWLRPRCGSIMRDCSFENIIVGFNAVLEITDSCFQQEKGWDCAFQLINNQFINCGSSDTTLQQGGEMISLRCNHSERGYLAKLDSNRIDSTRAVLGQASGMYLDASCTVKNTVFNDVLAEGKPQVYVYDRGLQDTLYFRSNSFSSNYYGMEFWEANSAIDARWNWWGDSTGPYHPQNNPTGTGAGVDDGVRFNPWLVFDPDTTEHDDSTEFVSRNLFEPAPDTYTLSAFPNPFNATTTLKIEVTRPGAYNVILYDVTGRIAARVFSGRIEREQTLRIDGAGLASGIYFARLSGGDGIFAVGKILLLK